MEEEIERSSVDYTREFKAQLEERFAQYKSGNAKVITDEESKERIEKILRSRSERKK